MYLHQGVGGVSAPRTGHTAWGMYQHQGQGTQQMECISTTDRAHGVGSVAAPWTGHTGLYPQARGTEPESSRMLTAAGVGHSCSTAIVSAAARGSGLRSAELGPWLYPVAGDAPDAAACVEGKPAPSLLPH